MRNIKRRLLPGLLALTLLLSAGAALAAGGGKSDPLVTLSYLTDILMPELLDELTEVNEDIADELSDDLSEQIDDYEAEMEALIAAGSTDVVGSDTYVLVTLTDGQTMALDVGCELMLRVGSATINAATAPALIDITTGGTINNAAALTKNHLYMATIPDRTIGPVSGTVKLLVRGGYSVTDPIA